jgi:hypothetical protein
MTPFKIKYEVDEALSIGEQYQSAGGYTGYKAEAYRIEYVDGVETSRTLVNKSTYYKYDRVIKVAPSDPRAGTTINAPGQSANPYIPVEPSPVTPPAEPDTPVVPVDPSNPSTPSNPDTPITPGTPDVPEVPVTPGSPSDIPASPGNLYYSPAA